MRNSFHCIDKRRGFCKFRLGQTEGGGVCVGGQVGRKFLTDETLAPGVGTDVHPSKILRVTGRTWTLDNLDLETPISGPQTKNSKETTEVTRRFDSWWLKPRRGQFIPLVTEKEQRPWTSTHTKRIVRRGHVVGVRSIFTVIWRGLT